jgi:hypothetical protein
LEPREGNTQDDKSALARSGPKEVAAAAVLVWSKQHGGQLDASD